MGHALTLVCPNCKSASDATVIRTDPKLYHWNDHLELYLNNVRDDDLAYRSRDRRCSLCRGEFKTVELSENDFRAVAGAVSEQVRIAQLHGRAVHALRRTDGLPESEIGSASGAIVLLLDIFHASLKIDEIVSAGSGWATRVDAGVEEALASLPLAAREHLSRLYAISAENSPLNFLQMVIFPTQKALRMLRHPSRSRPLRKLMAEVR